MRTKKRIHITTFGCQMNLYDTEVAHGILEDSGYELLLDDAGRVDWKGLEAPQADVILMNTCSVRGHAEDRVFGRLGLLGRTKRKHPELMIGLMGCMVEEHKENLFRKYPMLDFMVGTRNIQDLPKVIDEARRTRKQVMKIKREGISIEYTDLIKRREQYHAWLPIMTGCDKVCTYCIVPITRGSEVSMSARDVYREASRLVSEGVKMITLLGQNVNSYRGDQGGVRFHDLLEQLCQIEGLERISFTTSHPHDATEELFQAIARNPKISRHFHLPLQSASNRVLKRMKRLHQFSEYEAKVNRLRELVPDVSLTTDLICGFSGESEEDFEETMNAVRSIRFDSAYIYKYSLRPGTPAARLKDEVPLEIKERRHQEMLALQKQIMAENNRNWIGRDVHAFLSKRSEREPGKLIGRTDQEKTVLIEGGETLLGSKARVRLVELRHETFQGILVNAKTDSSRTDSATSAKA